MARASGQRLHPYIGYQPDGRIDDVLVEVKRDVHSFRNVRASIMGLAYHLAVDTTAQGALLVLVDSRITQPRLERELELAAATMQAKITNRLWIVLEQNGKFLNLPSKLGKGFEAKLKAVVDAEIPTRRARAPQYVILQLLIHQWLLGEGPMTREWLIRMSGASYPTVAAALKRYEHVLTQHSDRRVELRRFPREEWAELAVKSEEFRQAVRFVDRSGQTRPADSLRARLAKRPPKGVALGGVEAARYYDPHLDLRGTPRLDITIAQDGPPAEDVARHLDPALEPATSRNESPSVVIHRLQRPARFFTGKSTHTVQFADPVETLLDLHEAHLEPQAEQLLKYFMAHSNLRQKP